MGPVGGIAKGRGFFCGLLTKTVLPRGPPWPKAVESGEANTKRFRVMRTIGFAFESQPRPGTPPISVATWAGLRPASDRSQRSRASPEKRRLWRRDQPGGVVLLIQVSQGGLAGRTRPNDQLHICLIAHPCDSKAWTKIKAQAFLFFKKSAIIILRSIG